MDVSTISAIATQMSQERTASAVQIAVLKKAMDIEAQGAMQLIQAAVQASAMGAMPANPPHLGNQVNTFA
jgi:hypothetical protein